MMVDDPTTKAQAQALLVEYYEQENAKAERSQQASGLPKKTNLLSWDLKDDGTMVVVDGASGRKLTFAPEEEPKPKGKSKNKP
jgi:hypothetical protein